MSARVWFARDTGFTSDPQVQLIGDEHGPGGPLVIEEMLALAKLKNNAGSLGTSYATLARRAFVTPAKARLVVAAAAGGEDPIVEMLTSSPREFTARFLKWTRWQPKDPTGAARKAAQRGRERGNHGDVT